MTDPVTVSERALLALLGIDCLPCSYADRTGDVRSVTRISDFYSARQWHATGMYSDYMRPAGFEHELTLCLPGAPGRTCD